jgi:uncharacterized protein (DUF427 family)
MVKAIFNNNTIAESDNTEIVEGNHYFPRSSVKARLTKSETPYTCPWKGVATYWNVDGEKDLGWSYEVPKPEANNIKGFLSFDPKVKIEE